MSRIKSSQLVGIPLCVGIVIGYIAACNRVEPEERANGQPASGEKQNTATRTTTREPTNTQFDAGVSSSTTTAATGVASGKGPRFDAPYYAFQSRNQEAWAAQDKVIDGKLADYDWLHLHHEDFTGQFGKFYQ